jgi:hypothetical protein
MLIYFAQKINDRTLKDSQYTYAWSAISRPPYLTALALWPKGDCWHGGGLFQEDNTVVLNHKPEAAIPHPNHSPHGVNVILKDGVCGEDDPLFSERLERDGWALKQEWKVENQGYPLMFLTHQPEIRERLSPDRSQVIKLTRSIESLDYSERFAVGPSGEVNMTQMDRVSWTDWDQNGRLVFARDGSIFAGYIDGNGDITERKLIDLNDSKPNAFRTPSWASQW